jgi:hypothetical protein
MKIPLKSLPPDIAQAILKPDPVEGEDILVEDADGEVIAAIIQADAYNFLLKKIEEAEDLRDSKIVSPPLDKNAKSIDDMLKDLS